jgi:hypothetical protein
MSPQLPALLLIKFVGAPGTLADAGVTLLLAAV